MAKDTFAIAGGGRVGATLGYLLSKAGFAIGQVYCRSSDSAAAAVEFIGAGTPTTELDTIARGANAVVIAVPDAAIRSVCDTICSGVQTLEGVYIFHSSGAHTSQELSTAAKRGARVGSLHPLQTFPSSERAVESFPGSYCAIEGDKESVAFLTQIAQAMGAIPFTLSAEQKPLYHAATCMVCNYLVSLIDAGLECYEACGLERSTAIQTIMPILFSTLQNVKEMDTAAAITGPIVRGDANTVTKHIKKLSEHPEAKAIYMLLGQRTIQLARQKGTLSKDAAERLAATLTP